MFPKNVSQHEIKIKNETFFLLAFGEQRKIYQVLVKDVERRQCHSKLIYLQKYMIINPIHEISTVNHKPKKTIEKKTQQHIKSPQYIFT